MDIAIVVSQRGECIRRKVGSVITDKEGRILATGFNGKAPGEVQCTFAPCPGAGCPSGTGLDKCLASHSEASALVQLASPQLADTIYVTTAPCINCVKMLLLTSINRVVFIETYPNSGEELWKANKRKWEQLL